MYKKPLPVPTQLSQPYWNALRNHEIIIQRCDDCGKWIFYPRSHCTACLSPRLTWTKAERRGKIYAFTFAHVPTLAEFADEVPQLLAVVELEEGPRINTVILGSDPDAVAVGTPVTAEFHDIAEENCTLLYFAISE